MDKTELRKEFDNHVYFIKSATTISLAEKRINEAFNWMCDKIEQSHKHNIGGGLLPKCPNCHGTGIDPMIPNLTPTQNNKPEQLGNEAWAKSVSDGCECTILTRKDECKEYTGCPKYMNRV